MGTYKQKVQKELYDPVADAAAKVGKDADAVVESPGFEKAGTYTPKEAKKYCPEVKKFLKQ